MHERSTAASISSSGSNRALNGVQATGLAAAGAVPRWPGFGEGNAADPASSPFPEISGTGNDHGSSGVVLLTIGEVADLLRTSERTVRRYIRAGRLRKAPLPGRLVRISRDDLNAFLDGTDGPNQETV